MDKYKKISEVLTVLFAPYSFENIRVRLNPYKQKVSVQFSDTLASGLSGVVYGKLHTDAQSIALASNASTFLLTAIPTPIIEVYLTALSGTPRTSTVWIR